jgi:hypothetical protein
MIHNEHLRRADESYEIRHDNNGNAVHAIEKDGCFIIYPTLHDLVMHQYLGEQTERFYIDEDRIGELYSSPHYMYYDLKKYWQGELTRLQ